MPAPAAAPGDRVEELVLATLCEQRDPVALPVLAAVLRERCGGRRVASLHGRLELLAASGSGTEGVGRWRDRLGSGERPMSRWPDLPTPGRLIELPLPLAPALCAAAGIFRRRAVGRDVVGPVRGRADALRSDGEVTFTGWWPAWTTLAQHALGQALFSPYELGSSDSEAVHWLLADRFSDRLLVGLALDVRQLLATQPSELAAAVEILGAEHVEQLIQTHLTAPARPPDPREIERQLERSRWLVGELAAWLDAMLAQLQP